MHSFVPTVAAASAGVLIWAVTTGVGVRRFRASSRLQMEQKIAEAISDAAWSDRHVESLLARFPSSSVALRHYTRLALDRNDWTEGLRRAEMFAARRPSETLPWLLRAEALRGLGRSADAAAVVRQARRRKPFDGEIALAWARLAPLEDGAEQERRYAWLSRWFGRRRDVCAEAARVLSRRHRRAEAEALLTAGMRRYPDAAELWHIAAVVAEDAGEHAEAARRWAELRQRFPGNVDDIAHEAEALARAGRSAEADRLVADASYCFPGNAKVAALRERLQGAASI